jgi:hypothetical protein
LLCGHVDGSGGDDASRIAEAKIKAHAVIQIIPRESRELFVSLKDLQR